NREGGLGQTLCRLTRDSRAGRLSNNGTLLAFGPLPPDQALRGWRIWMAVPEPAAAASRLRVLIAALALAAVAADGAAQAPVPPEPIVATYADVADLVGKAALVTLVEVRD